MASSWECDGRVFDSREAAEEYAAKLAGPPPIRRAGQDQPAVPSDVAGCGTVALVVATGALVVAGFSVLGQIEVSGIVVLLAAALVAQRADARIKALRAEVRSLQRANIDLQRAVWDLESRL